MRVALVRGSLLRPWEVPNYLIEGVEVEGFVSPRVARQLAGGPIRLHGLRAPSEAVSQALAAGRRRRRPARRQHRAPARPRARAGGLRHRPGARAVDAVLAAGDRGARPRRVQRVVVTRDGEHRLPAARPTARSSPGRRRSPRGPTTSWPSPSARGCTCSSRASPTTASPCCRWAPTPTASRRRRRRARARRAAAGAVRVAPGARQGRRGPRARDRAAGARAASTPS